MALPITVPYTFGNATTAIPLSNLDSDYATVYQAVNGIGNGSVALANVAITGGTISGNTTASNVTVSSGTFTNVTLSNVTISSVSTPITAAEGGTGSSSAFTANGVVYASSTSALATGSALTFDGTNFGVGTSSPAAKLESFITSTSTPALRLRYNSSSYYADHLMDGNGNYVIKAPTANGVASGNVLLQAAGTLYLYTNNAEAARIDTSGNLGLGVTPIGWGGNVLCLHGDSALAFQGANGLITANAYYNGGWKYTTTAAASYYYQIGGAHQWTTAPSGTAGNAITFTQAMTLDANGNLLVGTTSAADSTVRTQSGSSSKDGRIQGWLSTSNGGGQGVLQLGAANTGTSTECTIKFVSGATALGSSPTSANGTQYSWGMGLGPYGVGGNVFVICNDSYTVNVKLNYNSSSWISVSDERIKNITANIENANQIIANWRTVYYTLKSDETNSVKIGLIAQDVQKTLPEVVDVPTKEYDDNNKLIPLGVHYSEVVPVLVKAIQELSTLITAQQSTIQSLTERLTALEGART